MKWPSYLRLVSPDERPELDPPYCVSIEEGPAGEPLLVVTVSRHQPLVHDLRARLGRQLTLRRATPEELTFELRTA